MRFKNVVPIVLVMLMVITLLASSPGFSWTGWESGKSEMFGPRADRLIFNIYTNPELEYDALEIGEIDITEWTMTKERMDKYLTDPLYDHIGVAEYYERGIYQIDLNCNKTFPTENGPGDVYLDSYLGKCNPTADIWFRRACSYLADKARYVTEIRKGLAGVMETVLDPPPPYGPFEEYEGYYYDGPPYYSYDPSQAAAILDAHGWDDCGGPDGTGAPDGQRNIPQWIVDEDPSVTSRVNIDVYWPDGVIAVMRTDKPDWMQWSNLFCDELEGLGIPVKRDAKDRLPAIYQVLVYLSFHFYFGGWSFGTDPVYVRDLWYGPLCTGYGTFNINYANYSNPVFDEAADKLYFATDAATARFYCKEAQRLVKEEVPCIPLLYYTGAKGYNKAYVGPETPYAGETWSGLVNELGFGINTRYTKRNMYPDGYLVGDGENMTIRAGLSTDVNDLNPVAAFMYYDYEIMYMYNYETWLEYDPYHPGPIWEEPEVPWLAWDFKEELWDATGVMDSDKPGYPMASKITFFFRDDIVFHDGTPMTAYDAEFSVLFKQACGADVAWNYPLVEHVYETNVPDPYTLEIKFDVQSIFALHWVGYDGGAILPKHIWETIEDSENRTWTDPNWDSWTAVGELDMFDPANAKYHIGCGPYKWTGNFVQGSYYELEAYDTSTYHNLCPIRLSYTNWTTGSTQNVIVEVENYKWQAETVTVHVKVDDVAVDGSPFTVPVAAGRGAYPSKSGITLEGLPLGELTIYHDPVQGVEKWSCSAFHKFTVSADLNFDETVDIFDALMLAGCFGATLDPLHPRWDRHADVIKDFEVDIFDALTIAGLFGWPTA